MIALSDSKCSRISNNDTVRDLSRTFHNMKYILSRRMFMRARDPVDTPIEGGPLATVVSNSDT